VKKYNEWIEKNYNPQTAYGNCAEAVKLMQKDFPELVTTNGFVHDVRWGQREHWWLKTPSGEIVDPTKAQFPFVMEYEEIDDKHPARNFERSVCANCGEHYYIGKDYDDSTVCSSKCWTAYASYLNASVRG
jgi:hypothetical protein